MLITAKDWLGRRTKVYDQQDNEVRGITAVDLETRIATQLVFDGKRIVVKDGAVVTRNFDATGYKLVFRHTEGFIRL